MNMTIYLDGLDCAHCGEKIRSAVEQHRLVQKAELNFMAKKLLLSLEENAERSDVFEAVKKTVSEIEPDVIPSEINEAAASNRTVLVLEGLDCANCAEKIRSFSENLNGVAKAEMNFMAKKLTLEFSPSANKNRIIETVTAQINALEPDVKVSVGTNAGTAQKEEPLLSKLMIIRLVATAVLLVMGIILHDSVYALWIFLAAYAAIGTDIVIRAAGNLLKGRALDECFLMTIATLGAFFTGEYPEGVMVMFLYQLGEMFQSYAVRRSRKNITSLMDIRPDSANVKRSGEVLTCSPEDVAAGEIIVIKAGEKVPLDCEIVSGTTTVDTSALTGESVPVNAEAGSVLLSGSVNLTGLVEARVTKTYGDSAVSKILELVENSAAKKAKTENFITRFAKIYTPCVVAAAVLLAVIPMIIEGGYSSEWLYKALSFLVVSCPCALVISVPMSFFGGIGGASKRGILVKGGACFENLAKCRRIVFDKTGTLTTGTFSVTEIHPVNSSEAELSELAAYAESTSNHPAAQSVLRHYGKSVEANISAEEIAGKGVKAVFDKKTVLAGNEKLMNEYGIKNIADVKKTGTVIHIAENGEYKGYIRISDSVKPDSAKAVSDMKKSGIETVMLTGDRKAAAEAAAKETGVDRFIAELLPDGKVSELEKLMSDSNITAFVGDGINDAPVLMRSDVGIAMGALGSDAAIEAADVVLMTDEPSKINEAIAISKRTNAIVKQNIIFALGVKLIILILTAFGVTSMAMAIFGDVGVAVLAILNAMRAGNVKKL
ncbi:MAG: cadmium-translocating P-type ATPase [Oscillospiraceae bacterium]|nr:cadmium-translocating P-type ATPase [Oscillospiraceae bacterium]